MSTWYTWQLYSSLLIIVREHRKQRLALKFPVAEENPGDRKEPVMQDRVQQDLPSGQVFAPVPRDYSFKLNKKEKRAALKSALTSRVEAGKLIVVDELKFDEIKTKKFQAVLDNLKVSKALVVLAENDEKVVMSARNIPAVKTALTNTINVYDILKGDTLVLTKDAVAKIEEVYA